MIKETYNRLYCLLHGIRKCPCCGSWRIRIKDHGKYEYQRYKKEYRITCKTCKHSISNSRKYEDNSTIKKMWNRGGWRFDNTFGGNGWTWENKDRLRKDFRDPQEDFFKYFMRDVKRKNKRAFVAFYGGWSLILVVGIILYLIYR